MREAGGLFARPIFSRRVWLYARRGDVRGAFVWRPPSIVLSFCFLFFGTGLSPRLRIASHFCSFLFKPMLLRIHHVAIICSDYAVSKRFYTEVLGLRVLAEQYRAERQSYKLDLALPDGGQIELFSFPGAPARPSYPEAQGLRHLAFEVEDVHACCAALRAQGVAVEPIRLDAHTQRRFSFFADPDGLPLELYERSVREEVEPGQPSA